jgi:hypothetical protein
MTARCQLCGIGELHPPWNPGDPWRCKNPNCRAENIRPALELVPDPTLPEIPVAASIDIPLGADQ